MRSRSHATNGSTGDTATTTSNSTGNNNNNKSPRSGLRKSSCNPNNNNNNNFNSNGLIEPQSLSSSPLPLAPLETLLEDATSAPAIPKTSSPGTPPKKVWERSYRNFLKMRSGNSGSSSSSSKQQETTTATKNGAGPAQLFRQSSSDSNSRAARVSSLSAGAAADNDDERESSVRGGKLFASVFRGGSSSNGVKGSPGGLNARRKTKSFSSDELDVAMRRGTEKAYSPGNSRYHPVVKVQPSTSMPHMANVARSAGMVIVDGGGAGGIAGGGFSTTAAGVILRPRTSSSEDFASSSLIEDALSLDAVCSPPLSTAPLPPPATTTTPAAATSKQQQDRHQTVFNNDTPTSGIVADEGSSFSSAMKKAFTEFHNSSTTGRDAVSFLNPPKLLSQIIEPELLQLTRILPTLLRRFLPTWATTRLTKVG